MAALRCQSSSTSAPRTLSNDLKGIDYRPILKCLYTSSPIIASSDGEKSQRLVLEEIIDLLKSQSSAVKGYIYLGVCASSGD